VTAASGPERRIIDAARELAGLSDAAIYARFGEGSVSPVTAYARAIGEAQRLLSELAGIAGAAAQLAEIRALLAAFDWECDDRQLALEAIDRIVSGGQQ
jgi:hypothetical protein